MVLELKKGGIMSIKKELQQIIKNSLEKNNIDFDSNTIVYVIGVHLAQNSLFQVDSTAIDSTLSQLNASLSYQPLNTYPVLVGSTNVSIPVRTE